jgi:hypothetical protein
MQVIKSRRMGWVGHVARMGEERSVYRVLVGKIALARPMRRWENDINLDLNIIILYCSGVWKYMISFVVY